jgi:cytidylate kinase
MSVITISRGSYSRGKAIAEGLGRRLGYDVISRDVLLEASEEFNVPEAKLVRAIHDAPSFFDRFKHGKERYVAFIRKAFLERIRHDNVIYHGLAGHFLARGLSHVLKARITADLEDRIREEMKRESISADEARYILSKDDEERRRWSFYLYGIDTRDASLYDIVLHVGCLTAEDAIDILADVAQRPCFRSSPEAQQALQDKYVEACAHAALIGSFPKADVRFSKGELHVTVMTALPAEGQVDRRIRELTAGIEGIKEVRVHPIPYESW